MRPNHVLSALLAALAAGCSSGGGTGTTVSTESDAGVFRVSDAQFQTLDRASALFFEIISMVDSTGAGACSSADSINAKPAAGMQLKVFAPGSGCSGTTAVVASACDPGNSDGQLQGCVMANQVNGANTRTKVATSGGISQTRNSQTGACTVEVDVTFQDGERLTRTLVTLPAQESNGCEPVSS